MKRLFASLLSVIMILTLFNTGLYMPASADLLELTPDEEQQVFDAWFEFMYDGFFVPMNKYYDIFEEFENAKKDKILMSDTDIYCHAKYDNGAMAVKVIHQQISAVDSVWYERVGPIVFDFSGIQCFIYLP